MMLYKSPPAILEQKVITEATKNAQEKIVAKVAVGIAQYSGNTRKDVFEHACILNPKASRELLKKYVWKFWDASML